MKFTYDEKHKIMYIYFDHPDTGKAGSVKRTFADCWPGVNVDIGWDDRPIGFEIMYVERAEDQR